MALTYPLSYTQFLGALRVAEVTFRLSHPQEHTRLGDGTVISASLGASLWTGSILLAQANHPRHAQMEALLALMDQPGATFLCHDPRQIGPARDPTGAILGSRTVTIHSVARNLRELRIAGLPNGYVLSSGYMVGFQYGSSPVRRALHCLKHRADPDVGSGAEPARGCRCRARRFAAPPRLQGKTTAGAYLWLRAAGAQPWGQF